ncbi:unnamed protein product, partial [Effrenium voratum]
CMAASTEFDAAGTQNCSICDAGETFEAESAVNGQTCAEAHSRLADGSARMSCAEAQQSLKKTCCHCYICQEAFEPEEQVGNLSCRDAAAMAGNGSVSCQEAQDRFAACCTNADETVETTVPDAAASEEIVDETPEAPEVLPGDREGAAPEGTRSTTILGPPTEAEEYGEEATPFCKSLCLKTDVKEWNLTCADLPKEECSSTHFFQTIGTCERRLCVWAAPWKCSIDWTQACVTCNWPCGRKVTTSTTSTTTTTTQTSSTTSTSTATTTTTSTTTTETSTTTTTSTSTSTDTGDLLDHLMLGRRRPYMTANGIVVPEGCFDFCTRTNVRSLQLSCAQLPDELCQSENFYQTDVAGNRRHCRFSEGECNVDGSFVCNASMPICQVDAEGYASHSGNDSGGDHAAASQSSTTLLTSTTSAKTTVSATSATIPASATSATTTAPATSSATTLSATSSATSASATSANSTASATSANSTASATSAASAASSASATSTASAASTTSGPSISTTSAASATFGAETTRPTQTTKPQSRPELEATTQTTTEPASFGRLAQAAEQALVAAARECLAVGLSAEDLWSALNETAAQSSPAMLAFQEAVDVALLAGFTRANLKQTLKKAVAQKDLEAEALPPLSEDGLDLEFLCVAVCSKQVVASCASLSAGFCASGEFYTSSAGKHAICGLDAGRCVPGASFSCGRRCAPISRHQDSDSLFCKSLCYKTRSRNCSALSEEQCSKHFVDNEGLRACHWEAVGCSVDLSTTCSSQPECPDLTTTTMTTTTTTTTTVLQAFCLTLCRKVDIGSHVSACEQLSEAECKTQNYYATINGNRAMCSWSQSGCSLDTSASCHVDQPICASDPALPAELPEPMVPPFCFSLCAKQDVTTLNMTCADLTQELCSSGNYFETTSGGQRMLCAMGVSGCSLELEEWCEKDLPLCHATTAAARTSTIAPSTSTVAPSTTAAAPEIPVFNTGCQEDCPEVSASLCDSAEWKRTGKCACHCKKYRPHIVMLLVDGMGFNDFVDSSDLDIAWPFVKSLLPKSIKINSSYAEISCAPSRASFLTGRWQHHLYTADPPSIPPDIAATGSPQGWSPTSSSHNGQLGSTAGAFSQADERTIAQKLNDAGYKSYAVGKWQAGGVSWQMTPTGRGFSRFYGSYDDASDYVQHCDVNGHYDLHYEESEHFEGNEMEPRPYHYFPSGEKVVGKHTNTLFQEKAKQFINDHKEKYGQGVPLFLYYAPMSFAEPLQAPKWTAANCTAASFSSAANAYRQTLCRMATALDRSIEGIASTMAGAFPGDNWIMVVASDGGGSAAHKRSGASNWPLRGSKGEVWEGAMRTKALLTGTHPELDAAATKGKTYTGGFMHLVDWHATLLQLAHSSPTSREVPNDVDGIGLWRALVQDAPSPRTEFISNISGRAIRSGDYKLVWTSEGKSPLGENQGIRWPVRDVENQEYLSLYDSALPGSGWTPPVQWKLFNIRTDPTEERDLAAELPEKVRQLEKRYKDLFEGRKSYGNLMLNCDDCSTLLAKVMRKHSSQIAMNKCPVKEAAYPFWEEAQMQKRPFE